MNRKKLIPLLLFLLLLLLILCVWCHSSDIVKNRTTLSIETKIKKIVDFEHISFELNEATLTKQSINTVSHIASVLNNNPNVRIEIKGHTDDSGDAAHNLNLSQSRVNAVKEKLIEMNISDQRIKAVGYGETQALVSNDTEANRRTNRRVEFKVLGE